MRNISKTLLLSAGILLTLAGCQKGTNTSKYAGQEVRFGVATGNPSTRTVYSGEGTTGTDGLTWERINWLEGDQVMIASPTAKDRLQGDALHYSTYYIRSVSNSGNISTGSIDRVDQTGLVWGDDETYTFYGVYPASVGNADLVNGKATYSIPASQPLTPATGSATVNPDMTKAVMLAVNTEAKASGNPVELKFYPAYTAFTFNVAAEVAMSITGFSITSVERKNGAKTFGPSKLSGTVTAEIDGTEWGYTIADEGTTLSTTFATPLALTLEEGATKTNEVSFTLFAVPADITSLTLQFNVTVDGKAETRKLTISYAKAGDNFAAGDPVTFGALKKHNIKGIVLPKSVNHDIVLDFKVMPWVNSEGEVTYGTDPVINANALEYISGAAITSGSARRHNNNFANETDPILAYFSVFTPTDGKWKITVTGDTDKFTVTGPSDATNTTEDGTVVITGAIDGRENFSIARNGATESDSIQINFSVVTSDGREISINSEVTRANALTITGKIGQ